MFTVDAESQIGSAADSERGDRRSGAQNSDMMIAFASIDPHKGRMGVREARRLIEDGVISGFKFHPTVQGFFPQRPHGLSDLRGDGRARLPAIFHSGHSGIGTGMRWWRRAAAQVFEPDAPR